MRILDRVPYLGGDSSGEDDKPTYRIVANDAKGRRAPFPDEIDTGEWRFPADGRPTKEQFKFEYGGMLSPGVTYHLGPVSGRSIDFDAIEWSLEIEPVGEPEWVSQLDEIFEKWNRRRDQQVTREQLELQLVEQLIEGDIPGPSDDPVVNAREILRTQVWLEETLSGGNSGTVADKVEDQTDLSQVSWTILLELVDNPEKLRDLTREVSRGINAGLGKGPQGRE